MDNVFGFPFNVWLGHNYHYFTKDPHEVKTILHNVSAQNKGNAYQDIAYVFQNSLLTIHCKDFICLQDNYFNGLKQFS